MNRKFRVWDNEKKQMIYPDTKSKEWDYIELTLNGEICLYDDDDGQKSGLWEHSINFKKDRFVLEMFTGLKDKIGKEVYEGDIVSSGFWGGTVEFIKGAFKIVQGGCAYSSNFDVVKIISNIHQNPKLLEKSK